MLAAYIQQKITEWSTYTTAALAWISATSGALTVIIVFITGAASIYFGTSKKRTEIRNAAANEERNRINKRSIIEDLIDSLDENKEYSTEEIKKALRK